MLKKFISIDHVGRFANCRAAGDVELTPLTLIFGENGRGKTTLCGILRSLASSDCSYLTERHTLGASDAVKVAIQTSSGIIKCKDGAWDSNYDNISVFDSTFVHENVFAGEHVDHGHKKNLHRVIVGRQGIQLNDQIAVLDSQSREVAKDFKRLKAEVKAYLGGSAEVSEEEFVALEPSENLDHRIVELDNEISSLKRSSEIHTKDLFKQLPSLKVQPELKTLLVKQLNDVSSDAEDKFQEHLRSVTKDATEGWICLLYTSPSPRDQRGSRMPSSA